MKHFFIFLYVMLTISFNSLAQTWVNGSNLIYYNSGKVGIGTSSPEYLLDIKATGNNMDVFKISHPTAPTKAGFIIGFDKNLSSYDNGCIDFKVEYRDSIYKVLNIDRANRNIYYIGNGKFGIGTNNPTEKLCVNGTIKAKEIKVESGWADFVFDKNYKLPSLAEVEKHIKENGHLESIPTETEVKENGVNLGEMNAKLLQKVEELTLYLIEHEKENRAKDACIEQLIKRVNTLEKQIQKKH